MRPVLIVFDVNETLSDMAPMADRFQNVGAPRDLARTWFAALLRDGFALTATGDKPSFATLAGEALRVELTRVGTNREIEAAVTHIMEGFAQLALHSDVAAGVDRLAGSGFRLVTLSNGSSEIAQRLLMKAGIDHHFEAFLSVDDASAWKPGGASYQYMLDECSTATEEAMLVAVHPWDLDGAAKKGMSTAWINRSGDYFPTYFHKPTFEVATIGELAEKLG